jgi:hypothetical protein
MRASFGHTTEELGMSWLWIVVVVLAVIGAIALIA